MTVRAAYRHPGLIGVALLVALLLATAVWIYTYARTPASNPEQRIVRIDAGDGMAVVAENLVSAGVLEHPEPLILLARLRGDHRRIKAGEFEIPPGITPLALLDRLVAGRSLNYPVTLIEGWTVRDLRRHLAQIPHLRHITVDWSRAELMEQLGAPGLPAEGRFLPETYYHPRGATDLELLGRAKEALDRVLAREWAGRAEDLSVNTPDEGLILASVIQKETGPGEEAKISGVFHRRLRLGMRLQADPTVIYGLGTAFDGNLRRADLRRDTPYNTYTRGGLPPTPIALAGRQAIHAALHPEVGESLYFVARRDGLHHFSPDLASHQAAVRRYQLGREASR